MHINTLGKIAIQLNKLQCKWAVGSSVLLNFYDLVNKPNDIDILIDANDSEKIKKVMDKMGKRLELPSKEPFRTKEFFGYNIDGIDIEFMGDFSLVLENNSIYKFILDDKSIKHKIKLDNIDIPTTTLEDWFVAYLVMKDPKGRVPIIKKYFSENNIKFEELLQRNLKQDLPQNIKDEIIKLLEESK